jgi:hypothetical protein
MSTAQKQKIVRKTFWPKRRFVRSTPALLVAHPVNPLLPFPVHAVAEALRIDQQRVAELRAGEPGLHQITWGRRYIRLLFFDDFSKFSAIKIGSFFRGNQC